ncbi:uncharacterized protein [Atheta coriaria]|uniref:uncharacterized protein isoform X6 n=1 Tax=Dalotia coriaria TaxID=877792 RepID=UPI0031F43F24
MSVTKLYIAPTLILIIKKDPCGSFTALVVPGSPISCTLYLPYPCNPMSATLRANAISWGNCSFTKFGRTQCRGATVLSPNLFSGRTQCRKTTVFSPSCSGQSHCRGATVLSPNSGERNVVGQPFLH